VRERSEKNVRETALQAPKLVEKEGRRCTRHQSRESPAACGEDHDGTCCPPVAHGGPRLSSYTPCSHRYNRWTCPKGSCSPWRACTGAGFWQNLQPVGDTHWTSLSLKGCTP